MERKDIKLGVSIILISILLSGTVALVAGAFFYADRQYRILSNLASELIITHPEDELNILQQIKDNNLHRQQKADRNYLAIYGFEVKNFAVEYIVKISPFIVISILLMTGLIIFINRGMKDAMRKRIETITKYLENINMGREVTILPQKEDAFALLEDEIYKTVTTLYETRNEAITVKENYADNLANIAHQMKTPLTSMSLMTQLLNIEQKGEYLEQLQIQVERLTRLEETLLILARIDAGVLSLEKDKVEVYTMLQVTVEGLEELAAAKSLEIVLLDNSGTESYLGDREWSMEAFTNLIKNCMEYAKTKVVIEYLQNPIYLEIKISDDGDGFAEKDFAHMFERFYRGSRAKEGGIGIGLALAKAIISMQNGCIEAKNIPEGGASFIVRFYCH
ncbi:MAG: Signal transduction histidine kinase [Herbinix sp.]|jgi:signal transduction histidine kinase|nr:Signal transduction histidine kinase [Herbinix sp.]